MKRRHFAKKMTRKQKAVVPNMMAAVLAAEAKTVEECERGMEGRDG
jgi:hypothetical protein